MEKKLAIADIKVRNRVRKDMGDIDALAHSIKEVGLLQAITVTKEGNQLVCGGRRLAAAKRLGWDKIDARMMTIDCIAEAEQAENEFRRSLSLMEKAQLARIIEEQRGRRKHGGDRKSEATKSSAQNGHLIPEGIGREELAVQSGFRNHHEMDRAKAVADHGSPELVHAVDCGQVPLTRAAKLATTLSSEEQEKVLAEAKREDGRYDWKAADEVSASKPAVQQEAADKIMANLDRTLGRAWGIQEQFGSVKQFFQKFFKGRGRKEKIAAYASKVDAIATAYADLRDEVNAYIQKELS